MNDVLPYKQGRVHRLKFTTKEDMELVSLVQQFGPDDWGTVSSQLPGRSPRQCRDRWNHYLAPHANNSSWSQEEEDLLLAKLRELGPQWSRIALFFPGRTGISLRNHCCKLARRENPDPILSPVLFGHSKRRLKSDVVDARELAMSPRPGFPGPAKPLPSCLSLMASASVSEDATKLFPLFLKN
jgi:hypothetical protein